MFGFDGINNGKEVNRWLENTEITNYISNYYDNIRVFID
jgi:hypothetical protein